MTELAYPITVVGVGPGCRKYLLPAAEEAVRGADVLVGGRSALALFDSLDKEKRLIRRDLDGILEYIDAARQEKRVAVLLSGDPGFYSLLPRLQQRLGAGGIIVIPGVSSLQLACARLGIRWDDLAVASVHGRGLEGLADIAGAERAAVLTEPKHPPAAVCRRLLEQGSRFRQAWVLSDLGLPSESIAYGTLETVAGLQGLGNSILILLRDALDPSQIWREQSAPAMPEADGCSSTAITAENLGACLVMATPGLPDELFIQGEAPQSQSEVRALTLCKARLERGMVVYDIGAGTGCWTVEAARLVAPGTVWAVEQNPGAAALVRANLIRFGIDNANLVEGGAPEACRGLPPADCVLIGGSGGRLQEILAAAASWLKPRGRLVLTAVTPDTFSNAWKALQEEPWAEPEAVLLNLARVVPRGRARIWSGENPVFIMAASLQLKKTETGGGEPGSPGERDEDS